MIRNSPFASRLAAVALGVLLTACADNPTGIKSTQTPGDAEMPRLLAGVGDGPVAALGGTLPPVPSELQPGGAALKSSTVLVPQLGSAATQAAAGSVRHLVLENQRTGERALWVISNGAVVTSASLGTLSTNWHVVGSGDFNADQNEDIIWENVADGSRAIWMMNGAGRVAQSLSLGVVSTDWRIVGGGDYDGDNKDDIVLENIASGVRAIWIMSGGRVTRTEVIGTVHDWHMVATPDLNSDGKADILLESTTSGNTVLWTMTGGSVRNSIPMGQRPVNVHIVGATDVDGDGHNDILLENTSTGERSAWLENGFAKVVGSRSITTLDPAWHIGAVLVPTRPTQTENDMFLAAARTAFTFIENNTQPSTGLAKAHDNFQYITLWDIASQLAGIYSAHELGIIDDANYDSRTRKILTTLQAMPLFDGAAFNRFYDSQNGQMVNRDFTPSTKGFGWSATDIGRLLTILKVLAVNQPQYATQAQAIVNRLNMSRIVGWGKLQGVEVDPNGTWHQYDEVGLGYEQYAAAGFDLWGTRANESISPTWHAKQVTVLGVPVWVDDRGNARLTSEPYIMMGLETGFWATALTNQAKALLAVQQARYDQQHILTMVTEDAMPDGPYYFYYYSVYHAGKTWTVEAPGGTAVQNPRWVSTKAAFAWRAMFTTDYTWRVFTAVQPAAIYGDGWGAGVYEGSLQPTGYATLNTAGMVLESALYRFRGHSMISQPIS
jgi:hypothetical protein